MPGPAYRILTARTVVRCWQPADAPLLKAAVDASVEHLLPWMPWVAKEPESVESWATRLRSFRGRFDLDRDYVYGIFNQDERAVLGGTGLHTRAGDKALEIGYWIHVDHINQGLATEISAALTKVAFEVNGVDRVEIHCDPQNVRSAAVPRKLGYVYEAILRQRTRTADGAPRDTMIWTLIRNEYPASPSAQAQIQAFDARGQALL